jgi:hypothetical protein
MNCRLSPLLFVLAFLGCTRSEPSTDPELLRGYMSWTRANLWGQVNPQGNRYSHDYALGGGVACTIAGAVGLEWPIDGHAPQKLNTSPGEEPRFLRWLEPRGAGRMSWNHQYGLVYLRWVGSGGQTNSMPCCMLDTLGHVHWVQEISVAQEPRVSDLGTTALITRQRYPVELILCEMDLQELPRDAGETAREAYRQARLEGRRRARERDSVLIRFVDVSGEDAGMYKQPAFEFPVGGRPYQETDTYGHVEFVPSTDHFLVLTHPHKRDRDPPPTRHRVILCLDRTGSLVWEHEFGEMPIDEYIFADNGRLIIAHGSHRKGTSDGEESAAEWTSAICALTSAGEMLACMEREAELIFPVVSVDPPMLYFFAGELVAVDLANGESHSVPPLAPLYELHSSHLMWERDASRGLVRRHLGLTR